MIALRAALSIVSSVHRHYGTPISSTGCRRSSVMTTREAVIDVRYESIATETDVRATSVYFSISDMILQGMSLYFAALTVANSGSDLSGFL
jgi:hypothetical protein